LRVDEFDGEFIISTKSDLLARILRDGRYEPEWANEFLSHVTPGAEIIDVGANIGFYTIAAAKKGARVLAIEPTAAAFRRLSENVRRNGVEAQVVLYHGLVSDIEGEREFHVIEGMEEYASMAPIQAGYAREENQILSKVRARTLDSLADEFGFRPSLIKVDTEGAEFLVFTGAKKIIEKYRPIVMSELSNLLLSGFDTSGDKVLEIFYKANYECRLAGGQPLRAGSDGYGEVVFLPRN